MPKRSKPDRERLAQLQKKDACYIITCYEDEFLCKDHPKGVCERGFFSLFLQVLYGILFAKKYDVRYKVDFSNVRYAYSEAIDQGRINFWEKMVVQETPVTGAFSIYNQRFETFPLKIWNRSFLRNLHELLRSEIQFRDKLLTRIGAIKQSFKPFRTLGIHARRTDHYTEVLPVREEVLLKKIAKRISAFDKLFVATDDGVFLERLKRLYPEKLMAHDFYRSESGRAVHDHGGEKNGLLLAEQALLDCLSLSFCQELILSPSNLSYAALVFQPEIPYSLAESSAAAWSRRKTLLAYRLNQWGIRKW